MVNRLQIEKKKINWSFVTLVLILSLGVFLSACTTQTTSQTTSLQDQGLDDDSTDLVADEDMELEDDAAMEDVAGDDLMADSKTEEEKTQDMIDQLLADGIYEDQVTYRYHSGSETMTVTISVENDIVTAASIESVGETHPTSQKYIDAVNDELPNLVVGKNIADVQMPERVSGSSLTTAAFQGYVDSLISQ